jgi:hypothetical protein
VLLRELGIPSRVAIGFTTGQSDGHGGYTITTADAHAWPEVYFSGQGWVRFEPTPRSDGSATVPDYTFRPQAASSTGPDGSAGSDGSSTTNSNGGVKPFVERGDPNAEPGVGPNLNLSGQHASHTRLWLAVLAAGALLVVLLAGPGVARVLVRRRRLTRQGIAAAWREVVDSLIDCGIPVGANEAPRGLARRLTGRASAEQASPSTGALLSGPAAADLWSLAAQEEHRRYAPDGTNDITGTNGTNGTNSADPDVAGWVRHVRHGLLGTLSRTGRLRATVTPASVWGQLRTRVPVVVADALDAGDRLIAAVVGRLPRLAGRG